MGDAPREVWMTVQVDLLPPGWVNLYEDQNGRERTEPCPAFLLQERRGTIGDDVQRYDPPYDTRVVAAVVTTAVLEPANVPRVVPSGWRHLRAIGPEHDPTDH